MSTLCFFDSAPPKILGILSVVRYGFIRSLFCAIWQPCLTLSVCYRAPLIHLTYLYISEISYLLSILFTVRGLLSYVVSTWVLPISWIAYVSTHVAFLSLIYTVYTSVGRSEPDLHYELVWRSDLRSTLWDTSVSPDPVSYTFRYHFGTHITSIYSVHTMQLRSYISILCTCAFTSS